MKTSRMPLLFYFMALSWGASPMNAADLPTPPERASMVWKPGDSWTVTIEAYSIGWALAFSDPEAQKRSQLPRLAARFSMDIRVLGASSTSNAALWQLEFVPGKDAPVAFQKQRCRVWFGSEDKRIHRVLHVSGDNSWDVSLEVFDGLAVIEHPVAGFPLQYLPTFSKITTDLTKEGGKHLQLDKMVVGTQQSLEARCGVDSQDGSFRSEVIVRQVSSPEANWWKTNETYVHGHLLTRAWLQSAAIPETKPPVEPKGK